MARIRKLELGTSQIRVHGSEVDATYQVVDAADGTKYFHLATYGSDDRKSSPKVSQTIQLDVEKAQLLVAALRSAFGSAIEITPKSGSTEHA